MPREQYIVIKKKKNRFLKGKNKTKYVYEIKLKI